MRKNYGIGIAVFCVCVGFLMPPPGLANGAWKTVRIESDEHRFVPNRITLKAGEPVQLEIHNIGNEEHEFRSGLFKGPLVEVHGNGVIVKSTDVHSVIVGYRATALIRWLSPEPGRYYFECRIPSHHGMDGEIVVEE
jgi:uncharacterized cupredoxin-like copper-binding protein